MAGRKTNRWLPPVLILALGLIGWTVQQAQAQNSFGSVVGTVTDATGAIVSGSQVTLKNNGTAAAATTTSGAGGTFTFLNLNPGAYTINVTNTGFKTFSLSPVDVQIGGSTRVNAVLDVGDISQTMNVEASSTVQLQTDSASLGGVVEGRQVAESPLNGRNVNNLLDFIPGVVPGGGTAGNTMANGGSGSFQAGAQTQAIAYGNYQIGGGFSGQSLFFIDGVGSNVPENNVNSLVPTQDSVQEFRVSTNNVSAEFGGFAGGVVQISTKSGTNQYHGTVYEYFRNTALDANDWFTNHAGLMRTVLHQNQYGGNFGGPILKNKLFAFFSFERESLSSGAITSYTLPTAAQLSGNFQGVANIYNPATGVQYACNGVVNTLCANQIDPTALKILQLETPLPNRPGLVNNFVATAPITGFQNQFNARVDYNVGEKDQIFARYTFWNPHNGTSDPLGTKVGAGGTGNTTTVAVVGDNHSFNSTTIADMRASWLENYNYQFPLSNGFNQSTINANYGTLQSEQVNNHQGVLPGLGIQGYSVGAELSQLYWLNTVYTLNGSVTKVKGRHTVKIGASGRQVEWTGFGNNQGVGLNALPSFSASSTVPGSGNAIASFLLGIPSSVGISEVGSFRAVLHPYSFYATDIWQTTSKLTLNLGLRWDQPGSYTEVNDNNTVLQPNATCALSNCSFVNPVTGTSQILKGNLAFVNSQLYPARREESLHYELFSPRVGVAYRTDAKTVVRGGYGISYLPAEVTADSPAASPLNTGNTNFTNSPGVATQNTVANPFPNPINLPSGRNPAVLQSVLGQGIAARIPDQKYGSAQQWNFGVERALDSKSTLSVAYAGAKGTHLTISSSYTGTGLNLNQIPDMYLPGGSAGIVSTPATPTTLGTGLYKVVANPLYAAGIQSGGLLGSPTILAGNLLQPYPQYTGVNQVTPRFGASTYEALQVAFQRRFTHGGQVQLAYTYAKLLSNTDNTSAFEDGQGGHGVAQDNTNLHAEKSISMQDLTHNLVINYGVDLPFGHDQMFLSNSNGMINAMVGGWRVNGITTLHSGLPIPFITGSNTLSQDFGGGTYGILRPNYTAGCQKSVSGTQQSKANKWFNTDCFTQPGDLSFGTERRVDTIRSAGAANFDFSANKNFTVYDKLTGKFSVEAFNLFNRSQFGQPDSNLSDGGFGTVTSQQNLPRVLQFAMRFSF
jgi:hypothetical protein